MIKSKIILGKMAFRAAALTLALVFSGACAPQAFAGHEEAVYTSWKDNLAVGGYDTVSFFSGNPVQGKAEFSTDYNGASWQFSNQGNLELFKANPDVFMPQYGGYCAWAVANNKLAKGSPEHWHVEDGKLYLNFNARIKQQWKNDIAGFITRGNTVWPDILDK